MALNSLFCADVPLSNYSLTHPSVMVWGQGIWGQIPGMGSGFPPFPAICKSGSTCPRAHGVDATLSDIWWILLVSLTSLIFIPTT